MELRIYPEYIGNHLDFQIFLLKHFKLIHYAVEAHTPSSPVHIHALLKEPVKKTSPIAFKRLLQKYKKRYTTQKMRNNALHISDCDNEPCFIEYLKKQKEGGCKHYFKLRHPYCFDTNYYVGEL